MIKRLSIVLLAFLMYFNTVFCVNVSAQTFSRLETEKVTAKTDYRLEDEIPEEETDETEETVEETVLEEIVNEPVLYDLQGDVDDDSQFIIDDVSENLWTISAYYVNEKDPYYTHKTAEKFNLAYQMEFHTDTDIPKYAIRITVPAVLLTDRNGKDILPDDVAVPEAKNPVYKDGMLESIDFTSSKNIGFNYYYETIDGVEYIVFFNYKTLAVGTSAAFQVLYKNLLTMELKDNSSWDLPVDISVVFPPKQGEEKYHKQIDPNPDLTGDIDSEANLTSAAKIAYKSPSTDSYTPALYTRRQCDAFITWKDPDNYSIISDSEEFAKYRYAVWEMSVKVSDSTQPYYVDIVENLLYGAKVVGISSGNVHQPLGVTKMNANTYRIWDNSNLVDKGTSSEGYTFQKEKNITYTNVRVVVAYPRESFDDYPHTASGGVKVWDLPNSVTAVLTPVDGVDDKQFVDADASFPYKEYEFHYGDDGYSAVKANSGVYYGWSNAYLARSANDKDHGGIPFDYNTSSRYYKFTHYVKDEENHVTGQVKDNHFTRLTATDDLVYLSSGENGMDYSKESGDSSVAGKETFTLLERGDYYFESVKVSIIDRSFDVFEDAEMDVKEDPDYVDHGTTIYAMFELDENLEVIKDTEKWEPVITIDPQNYDEYKDQVYKFDADTIARHPYRLMTVHESNSYNQSINYHVSVALDKDSETVHKYIEASGEGNNSVNSVTLENNGGILVQTVEYYPSSGEIKSINKQTGNRPADASENNYGKTPVDESGKAYVDNDALKLHLYDESEYKKDNAYPSRFLDWYYQYSPNTQGWAYLNKANPIARTNKYGTVSNDPVNARINVKYNIVAYDGYEIYDSAVINYMKESDADFTGHSEVVFYDLLPLGVEFDASVQVVAGRLTDANEKQVFKYPNAWDQSKITVTVDPDKDVITNFNGTGQTMVVFHVKYDGSDPTVYTVSKDINGTVRSLWIEGFGVSYGAYYIWENVNFVESENSYNIFAFTTDKDEDNKDIVGKSSNYNGNFDARVYTSNNAHNGLNEKLHKDDSDYADLIVDAGNKGMWADSNFKEVIFGKGRVEDIYAKSSQAEIRKGVRADSDGFGSFESEAKVKLGETYTYEIVITTAEQDLEEIIIYDHIENVINEKVQLTPESEPVSYIDIVNDATTANKLSADFEIEPVSGSGESAEYNSWFGKLVNVNTKSLELQGVDPAVYYSIYRDATVPVQSDDFDNVKIDEYTFSDDSLTDEQKKNELIDEMKEGKWLKDELFLDYFEIEEATSYAVDMRTGKDGNPFVLPKMTSISYRSTMKSPLGKQTDIGDDEIEVSRFDENLPAVYAYNNVSYSSSMGSADTTTLTSNPTRVSQVENDQLIIEKEVDKTKNVPENFKDQEFVFTVTYVNEEYVEEEYTTADGSIKTRMVIKDVERPYANRYYELEVKEDGEWTKVTGSVYATDANGQLILKDNERAVFKAPYKEKYNEEKGEMEPLIIVTEEESPFWKQVMSTDLENDPSNEFKIYTVKYTNTFRPFLYVTKNVSEYGKMDLSDVEFSFTLYKKSLLGYVPADGVEYWRVASAYADGTAPERIDSEVYKTDKDGRFTIKANETVCMFAGYEGDAYRVVENNEETEDWVLLTDKQVDGNLEVVGNIVVYKNRYRLRDLYISKKLTHYQENECSDAFTFKVVLNETDESGNEFETPLKDYRYYILDEQGNKQSVPAGVSDPEIIASLYEGQLNEEGCFTAPVGNKKVLIEGLEYSKTYTVYELVESDGTATVDGKPSQWRALNSALEVTMPVYSMSKELEFTNDYLLRPLSVSKTVVSKSGDNGSKYTMRVTVDEDNDGIFDDDEILRNREYIRSDGSEGITEDDGTFEIGGGETFTFKYLAREGVSYRVEEMWNGGYIQIMPFQMIDDTGSFPVDEDGNKLPTGAYQTPLISKMDKEGSNAMIINGESGVVLIGKEYIADSKDSTANMYLAKIQSEVDNDTEFFRSSEAVTMTLTVTTKDGETYIWPKEDRKGDKAVKIFVTTSSGTVEQSLELEKQSSFVIDPWVKILVDDLEEEGVTFVLSEEDNDASKMYVAKDKLPQTDGYITIEAVEQSVSGDSQSNPVVTISNLITSYKPASTVMKYMKPGSDPVVEGQSITFRVEEYHSGGWTPKKDVDYIMSEYDAAVDEKYVTNPLEEDDLYFVTGTIETTDEDGRIVYIKNTKDNISLYPRISFINDKVYTQLDDEKTSWVEGDLRLVELPMETERSWGQWYANVQAINNIDDTVDSYISNSNRTVQMELRKQLAEDEEDDGRQYTFILTQVLDGSDDPVEVGPGANIQYVVYDEDMNVVDIRTTDASGKIQLKASETARIDFADGTHWTFSEVQDSIYKLDREVEVKNPESEPDNARVLEYNLALVGAEAEKLPVLLVATPDTYTAILTGAEPANTYTVKVYYSDNTEKELSPSEYERVYTPQPDGKWNAHFTYEESGITLTDDVVLLAPSTVATDFDFTGKVQEFVVPTSGYYLFEAWGAEGGASVLDGGTRGANGQMIRNGYANGGAGAYTSGLIHLKAGEIIYVYVGGHPKDAVANIDTIGGWNGGGNSNYDHSDNESGGGGGGSTDFRLVKDSTSDTSWNSFESLKSRIMVAAGGGGATDQYNGGPAGGITSITKNRAPGATQTTGYGFGTGETAVYKWANKDGAGGGGGYMGGYTSPNGQPDYDNPATGGSSFISGHNGCLSIDENATSDSLVFTDSSEHYSNKVFTNTTIIPGNELMLEPNGQMSKKYSGTVGEGNNKITFTDYDGHKGDGHARITLIQDTTDVYNYTGTVQVFTADKDGYYLLEAWGAQGGSALKGYSTDGKVDYQTDRTNNTENPGGKGGYSTGTVYLNKGDKLYITVGGKGKTVRLNTDINTDGWNNEVVYATKVNQQITGGYNGGGYATSNDGSSNAPTVEGSGGGATSIQKSLVGNGLLSDYVSSKADVLLVAGGGGGSYYYNNYVQKYHHYGTGGAGGGLVAQGNYDVYSIRGGGNKTSNKDNYCIAPGQSGSDSLFGASKTMFNGGGWYTSAYPGHAEGGAGGSSYIGNPELTYANTISGNQVMPSSSGGTELGHSGNGQAKITYLGDYTIGKGLTAKLGGYINTLYVPTANTSVSVTYKYDSPISGFVFGSRDNDNCDYMFGKASSPNVVYWYTGFDNPQHMSFGSENIIPGVKYRFMTSVDGKKADLEVYDTDVPRTLSLSHSSTVRDLPSCPMYLFSFNRGNTNQFKMAGTIYEFKIYEGGQLVKNFIPAIENSTGKKGMLETINGVFYEGLGGQDKFTLE